MDEISQGQTESEGRKNDFSTKFYSSWGKPENADRLHKRYSKERIKNPQNCDALYQCYMRAGCKTKRGDMLEGVCIVALIRKTRNVKPGLTK
jgi:hypothetical protein